MLWKYTVWLYSSPIILSLITVAPKTIVLKTMSSVFSWISSFSRLGINNFVSYAFFQSKGQAFYRSALTTVDTTVWKLILDIYCILINMYLTEGAVRKYQISMSMMKGG